MDLGTNKMMLRAFNPDDWEPDSLPLVKALYQLCMLIDVETNLLQDGGAPNFADVAARKSRGLLDLNRAMAQIELSEQLRTQLRPLLAVLKEKLELNTEALQLNMRAVGELADIVHAVLEQHEADGTYTMQSARSGSAE